MTKDLTLNEMEYSISSGLCEFYQKDFEELMRDVIQEGENVHWVGNVVGSNLGYSFSTFGYLILTFHRIILVEFHGDLSWGSRNFPMPKRKTIETKNKKYLWGGHYRLYDIPTYPLSDDEISNREVTEFNLVYLISVQRNEFRLKSGKNTAMLQVSFIPNKKMTFGFYDIKDAHEVFSKLMLCLFFGVGRYPPKHNPDIADQLEKLTELHKYQVITDEEYEKTKRKLLK